MNPEGKPTKKTWTLSWPTALEICGKLFFNKGLTSDLFLLGRAQCLENLCFIFTRSLITDLPGKADRHDFFLPGKHVQFFFTYFFFLFNGLPRQIATIVNLENIAGVRVQNRLDKFWHNSERSY